MKFFTIIAVIIGAASAGVAVPAEATTTIRLPPAATETRVSLTPETEYNSTVSSNDKPRGHLEMFEATGINCNDKQSMSVRLNQHGTFCFRTEITIRRVRVINTARCSTTYFSAEHCTNDPQHVERALECVGYASGRQIKSIVVAC